MSRFESIACWCRRIAASRLFEISILAVIVANAVLLGMETMSQITARHGNILFLLKHVVSSRFCRRNRHPNDRLLASAIGLLPQRMERFRFHRGRRLFDSRKRGFDEHRTTASPPACHPIGIDFPRFEADRHHDADIDSVNGTRSGPSESVDLCLRDPWFSVLSYGGPDSLGQFIIRRAIAVSSHHAGRLGRDAKCGNPRTSLGMALLCKLHRRSGLRGDQSVYRRGYQQPGISQGSRTPSAR